MEKAFSFPSPPPQISISFSCLGRGIWCVRGSGVLGVEVSGVLGRGSGII